MTTTTDRTPTPGSGALSLLELRRYLLRRSSALTVRARVLRRRGDLATAARLEREAAHLLGTARRMGRLARDRDASC